MKNRFISFVLSMVVIGLLLFLGVVGVSSKGVLIFVK